MEFRKVHINGLSYPQNVKVKAHYVVYMFYSVMLKLNRK